jgi:serine/threonine protein kinase
MTLDRDEPVRTSNTETAAVLGAGAQLGTYVLEQRIGSGGMGDVFRARDTRLDRKVAIKICTDHFGERFEREAKTLSALNHPNICTLFDVGPNYLVMELVDGETLAARIERGPLALADAARLGAQIADALAEAHHHGIVHRDLKPHNIMLTRHGAKVLDFGIAKRTTDDALTQTGAVIGTAAYLAPEQLAGDPATQRSDLYALGVVLHEMLTGQRPLAGAPTSKLTTGTTGTRGRRPVSALESLVAKLLEPDPARRPESAAGVADELRALAAPPRPFLSRRWIAAAAMLAVTIVSAVTWRGLGTNDSSAPLHVVRQSPVTLFLAGRKSDPAYSSDGAALAFVWEGATGTGAGIYVLRDGESQPTRLTSGTTDISPSWASDGKRVAFLRLRPGRSNELMLVSVPEPGSTAAPIESKVRDVQQLENVTTTRRPMLAWAPDDAAIVVPLPDAESGFTSLFRVPLDGGAPRRVVASHGGQGDSGPAISRDGRWLAYADFEAQRSQLYVVPLDAEGIASGERQPVPGARGGIRSIVISPDGELVLWSQGAQLVEWRRGAGEPSVVHVASDTFQSITADWKDPGVPRIVSANVGRSSGIDELVLIDGGRAAAGPSVPVIRFATNTLSPALSPDGHWLAFQAIGKSGQQEIWLAGSHGEDPRTTGAFAEGVPILWSPDSRHLSYHARVESVAQLHVVDVDERGVASSPRQVTQAAFSLFGAEWSRDGKYLYSSSVRSPTAARVVRVSSSGGDLEDLFEGTSARISVDGTRIFYGKPQQPGLYERSLEGDIASNAETRVLEDYAPAVGFVPAERGIFYRGVATERGPAALRFFDFELKASFDLGPPPQGNAPTLAVSADGTRLLLERTTPVVAELTLMELSRGR